MLSLTIQYVIGAVAGSIAFLITVCCCYRCLFKRRSTVATAPVQTLPTTQVALPIPPQAHVRVVKLTTEKPKSSQSSNMIQSYSNTTSRSQINHYSSRNDTYIDMRAEFDRETEKVRQERRRLRELKEERSKARREIEEFEREERRRRERELEEEEQRDIEERERRRREREERRRRELEESEQLEMKERKERERRIKERKRHERIEREKEQLELEERQEQERQAKEKERRRRIEQEERERDERRQKEVERRKLKEQRELLKIRREEEMQLYKLRMEKEKQLQELKALKASEPRRYESHDSYKPPIPDSKGKGFKHNLANIPLDTEEDLNELPPPSYDVVVSSSSTPIPSKSKEKR